MKSFFRLVQYSKRHRLQISLATLCSVINKIFDIFPEILIGIAVDVVVNQKTSFVAKMGFVEPSSQIYLLGAATFIVWLGESVFQYLYNILWRNLAQQIQGEMRLEAFKHVQNLELEYFEDKSTGNLLSIINDDVNQLERFLDGGVNAIIQTAVSSIVIGAIFFYLAPSIAPFSMLPIPIILFIAYYFQNKSAPLYTKVRERAGDLSARLANSITGISTVKSYTAENFEARQLLADSNNYRAANKEAIKISSAFIPVVRIAIVCGFICTVVLGGLAVFDGALAVGSYSLLIFSTQRLLWPFTDLAKQADLYERAMASVRRILDLIETEIKIESNHKTNRSETNLNHDIKGHLEFSNINFAYANKIKIFENLNLNINPGQTIAFVGATGSGKSSIIKLLLRFYDAQSGEIKLDNINIRNYDLKNLRQAISFVSQDVFLFQGSIRENIAYGSLSNKNLNNLEEIKKAAKIAEAHEFISKLPEGYDTLVGERGMKLSGGQRQRLSIARAVLKNAPVFIFDEATSAVDNETEALIQRAIDKISRNKTTIIIAHRLSTIRHADKIFVMNNGEIESSGKHEELLESSSIYKKLWRIQTGE